MKSTAIKIIIWMSLWIFSFNSSFATLEDNSIEQELNKENIQELDIDFSLKTFDSCKNMEDVMWDYIKDYWEENWKNKPQYPYYNRWGWNDILTELDSLLGSESEAVTEEAVSVKPNEINKLLGWSDDFSETNTQVKWVDESDIVKTDGKHIYYYNSKDKYVYIVNATDKEDLDIVKKIKVPDNFYSPVLYIDNNRLTVVSGGYSQSNYKQNYWYNRNQKTYTIVFDTTDISNPKLIKLYASEGSFGKSRKIGDYLYILSTNSFDVPYYSFQNEWDIQFSASDIIPKAIELTKTSDGDEQNLKIKDKNYPYNFSAGKTVDCDEISYALPGKDTMKKFDFSPSYNVISVINMNDVEEKVGTYVVAGNNAEIFMSQDNLYMTSHMYQNNDFSCARGMFCMMPYYSRWENTLIHKINIDNKKLTYQDSTIIPGQPLTQYSMDEHDGKFRIITQKFYPERKTWVYVLDKDLKLLWNLDGLWKTEDFKSSRFMWDKLFLVTFKQIDPFYVIDMSTDQPKVMGELKIPGYSTYLHPYDENHIIGLGYNATENKWGWTINDGLKIDLYEIDYETTTKELCLNADWENIVECIQKYNLLDLTEFFESNVDTICKGYENCHIQKCVNIDCFKEVSVEYENENDRGLLECTGEVNWTDCDYDVKIEIYSECAIWENCSTYIYDELVEAIKKSSQNHIVASQKFTKTLGENGSYSEALNNPRMFMWNAAKNTLLLPAQLYVNSPEDYYKRIDFYQWLFALEINKDAWISEKYRVSHIDMWDIEKQRKDECAKYSQKQEETNCKILLDWSEYCTPVKKYNYVPEYCFADSNINEYKAKKSYNYSNDYVKRALWIWNTAISISDNKMMTTDLESGKKFDAVNMK